MKYLVLLSLLLQFFPGNCDDEETTTFDYLPSDFYHGFEILYHGNNSGTSIRPGYLPFATLILYFTWMLWHQAFPVGR
ncbi:hypothetical protein XELAEV_18040413mg [Xenopus laevis]|uniref:Uncharacterized protein n=1 Tax=Xenopus laevis TaxID=8355 RepID=A0A974C9K4_XENLA|nr:hypothetical protein XELAEV_18040413mg [Xenopus laevis]